VVAAELTAVEGHPLFATMPYALVDSDIVAAPMLDAGKVSVAVCLLVGALRLLVTAVRLEVRETAFAAAMIYPLSLSRSASPLQALNVAFAAAALHSRSTLAATALMIGTLDLTASATAPLCLLATTLMGLGLATMFSTALVGLGRCRSGKCEGRYAGYQDELPHHKSPIGSRQERPCYGGVPLFGTEWERPTAPG
jgi:hypothetical protein